MSKLTLVLAAFCLLLAVPSPARSGSCQDKDGMVLCTDDVGRDSTLRSLDKALGSPAPFDPPTASPDALKSFPSDIKSREERRKDEDTRKLSVDRPGIEKDTKK